jgi:hypothetical protein
VAQEWYTAWVHIGEHLNLHAPAWKEVWRMFFQSSWMCGPHLTSGQPTAWVSKYGAHYTAEDRYMFLVHFGKHLNFDPPT